jgi:hypothetical protein
MSAFSEQELSLIDAAHNDQRIRSIKISGVFAILGIICGFILFALSFWDEDRTAWVWVSAIFVIAAFSFAYALYRTKLIAYSVVCKLTPDDYRPKSSKLVPSDDVRVWAICAAVAFWVVLTISLGVDDLCDNQILACVDDPWFRQLLATPILILGVLWGVADAKYRGVEFSNLLTAGFVFLLPVAAPYYVAKTRGWKAAALWLLKVFGCIVLMTAIFFISRRTGLWPYGLT